MSQTTDRKAHWESVYQRQPEKSYSWYQALPERSLAIIAATDLVPNSHIIDVGGGDSNLVDHLLAAGYQDIDVLDISTKALARTKNRLTKKRLSATLIESDVTEFHSHKLYDLWHDRAVFHFLTDQGSRQRYLEVLSHSLKQGGHLILASFAIGGPEKCSGLNIVQYDANSISRELGDSFSLRETWSESHKTPSGTIQLFNYYWFIHE